jgi:YbgC/YbaW family acyl-CoA thioester hydrolase
MVTFTYISRIPLHKIDAAGFLFFGNYYHIAHDAYETFMDSIGISLTSILHELDYLVLIVHSECDYSSPLRTGDEATIELSVEKIGRSSFTLNYRIMRGAEEMATVKTIHAAVSKETKKPIPLPDTLRSALETIS